MYTFKSYNLPGQKNFHTKKRGTYSCQNKLIINKYRLSKKFSITNNARMFKRALQHVNMICKILSQQYSEVKISEIKSHIYENLYEYIYSSKNRFLNDI